MGLTEYNRKRDFGKTPEPKGKTSARPGEGFSFVVQKHAARRLHYDFRLELNGVLLSWAVPKGPSFDPSDKRLAMQTEDHPLEYGTFEGVIPKGQYGGGTVLLWDRGTWTPVGDPVRGLRAGKLKFRLQGDKLKGGWTLVRIRGRGSRDAKKSWLLIKERDETARPARQYDVTEEHPESVATGREMAAIAKEQDAVWESNRPENGAARKRAPVKLPAAGDVFVAGVRLTHPERVLYPSQGITKHSLAEFYEGIAEWILPEVADRPTTLVRCPEGLKKACFYQKHVPVSAPSALRRVKIQEKKKVGEYLVVDDLAGLVSLVQIGILEIHTWNSRASRLEQPDRLVFDLDPAPDLAWSKVVEAARLVRSALKRRGLESFVKTTGGKGLHVVAPLLPGASWEACAGFARSLAEAIVREQPRGYTASMAKSARPGKVFIDYLRNVRGATSVAAYSTRARDAATVSTPLSWDELDARLRPELFTVKSVPKRLAALKQDPWGRSAKLRQTLPAGETPEGGTVAEQEPPKPEDAYTGVTPGWQSGIGSSFRVPESEKHIRHKGEPDDGSRRRVSKGGDPRTKPAG